MHSEPDFYLILYEPVVAGPWDCSVEERLQVRRPGDDYLKVRLIPTIRVPAVYPPIDISEVVLATREVGTTLHPPSGFPLGVYVARLVGRPDDGIFSADDLVVMAWGELYDSATDAAARVTQLGGGKG